MRNQIIMVLAALALASCSEKKTTVYPTYADAVKDGAVGRGWVPEFVPRDAVDIRESHAVDVGQVVITFKSTDFDFLKSFNALDALHKEEAGEVIASINFPDYHPTDSVRYYFSCLEDGIGLLAFDSTQDRYYYFEPFSGNALMTICSK